MRGEGRSAWSSDLSESAYESSPALPERHSHLLLRARFHRRASILVILWSSRRLSTRICKMSSSDNGAKTWFLSAEEALRHWNVAVACVGQECPIRDSVRLAIDSFIHYNSMMVRMSQERWSESGFERIRGWLSHCISTYGSADLGFLCPREEKLCQFRSVLMMDDWAEGSKSMKESAYTLIALGNMTDWSQSSFEAPMSRSSSSNIGQWSLPII